MIFFTVKSISFWKELFKRTFKVILGFHYISIKTRQQWVLQLFFWIFFSNCTTATAQLQLQLEIMRHYFEWTKRTYGQGYMYCMKTNTKPLINLSNKPILPYTNALQSCNNKRKHTLVLLQAWRLNSGTDPGFIGEGGPTNLSQSLLTKLNENEANSWTKKKGASKILLCRSDHCKWILVAANIHGVENWKNMGLASPRWPALNDDSTNPVA